MMQNINKYIIEKLKKINSKTKTIYSKDNLKEFILNNNEDAFDIIDYIIKYVLLINIGDKDIYKKLLAKKIFTYEDRYQIYLDIKVCLCHLIFDLAPIDAIDFSRHLLNKKLIQQNKETLLIVLDNIIKFWQNDPNNENSKDIFNIIQNSIKEYFNEYEKN